MEEQPCVGESVIPYYGKYSAKQYIKGKPFKFGYKIWFVNSSQGYLLHYNLYAGRGNHNPMLGLGESVVSDLVATLPKLHWKTTFDNLFTSLNLLHHLSEHCVVGIGTLRANRTDKFPITDANVIGKENRRSYNYRYEAASKLVAVRWNDNSVVTLASNCRTVHPVGTGKRYSREHRKTIEVPEASVVGYYNKHMGGVDRMDQNISYYRISV